jgi:hypothetical protein
VKLFLDEWIKIKKAVSVFAGLLHNITNSADTAFRLDILKVIS